MIGRWAALLALSVALAAALEAAGIPAALLLGPLIAGVTVAVRAGPLPVPQPLFLAAQAVIGLLIGRSFTPDLLHAAARDWPAFLAITVATLAVSSVLGLVLARLQVLPGTVAIWGSMPGLASAMVLMARDAGEDYRLVAVMTYARVVLVALGASGLALAMGGGGRAPHLPWFPPVAPGPALATLAIAVVGASAALRLKVPAGAMLGPFALAAAATATGVVSPVLPGALLVAAYALVGWRIGLRFTAETLRAARGAARRLLLSTLLLIGFCALAAWGLARWLGTDAVTAYLATSPGGMDSVAIIAATAPVNVSLVMAMQATRLVAVLLAGPALVRWSARRFNRAGTRR